MLLLSALPATSEAGKTCSVFMPPSRIAKARSNAEQYPWAAEIRDKAIANAAAYMKLPDNDLWDLMFGATIPRSWMVWSNGFCPACRKSVPMYNWKMEALGHPWKVRCPHCSEAFPKNDFKAFYESGLDEHGVFDPKLANRSLLYNADHPDPKDPLHGFGVDDGTGYVDGTNKWRFIGAYLIYGQWKQAIVNGIAALGNAYCVTGDAAYAHKAAILLDRVADLYPTFDFQSQAEVYEIHQGNGYVSVWHDACGETRTMVMAYDHIFDAIRNDTELIRFLATKARRYRLENTKATFADIQRNIEDRILKDSLANRPKVESNYPQTDLNIAIIKAVLGWPSDRGEVNAVLDGIIDKGTAINGVTGEKGLTGYASWAVATLADMLELFSRLEPTYVADAFKRKPRLNETWQFYVDTWCLQKYYPNSGDCGAMASQSGFQGVTLSKYVGVGQSGFSFLGRLHDVTGDPAYLQLMYIGNGNTVQDLPHDIFANDPAALQALVQKVVSDKGTTLEVTSANKEQWHLAVLRSGKGTNARALWMDYDSYERHCHLDCMNMGLYAMGLDLMSDFGYPPVQYGGWNAPKAQWNISTASHNTVVLDGQSQPRLAGKCTLWADGDKFHAIRASAPEIAGQQYERTAVMVDTSAADSYVLDIFRVIGKSDHAKMQHTQAARLTTSGLSPASREDFSQFFRNTQTDPSPRPGWSVDFEVTDRRGLAEKDPNAHLRITDLTYGAEVSTCEAWVSLGISSNAETWIPETIVRRRGQAPLASTFVSIIEPYGKSSSIESIARLPLATASGAAFGDANVAVEVRFKDGRRDVLIAADAENPTGAKPSLAADKKLVQKENGIRLEGELCLVRFGKSGRIEHIALCKGKSLEVDVRTFEMPEGKDFYELGAAGE